RKVFQPAPSPNIAAQVTQRRRVAESPARSGWRFRYAPGFQLLRTQLLVQAHLLAQVILETAAPEEKYELSQKGAHTFSVDIDSLCQDTPRGQVLTRPRLRWP